MFDPFRKEDPDLVNAIKRAYEDLEGCKAYEEDYKETVKQLVKLQSFKKKTLDPNTVLTVAGNLAIGLAVLKYERINVVATRVRDFLMKI